MEKKISPFEKVLINDFVDAEYCAGTKVAGSIYHYTSPMVVKEILKKDSITLRFTRYDCVNDISEGVFAIEVYRFVSEDLLQNEKINISYYEFLLSIISDDFLSNPPHGSGIIQLLEAHEQVYICCFSIDPDSLPMWNYYLKNQKYEGYSIGFFPSRMNGATLNDRNGQFQRQTLSIRSVVYSFDFLSKIFRTLLVKYYKLFNTATTVQKDDIAICIRAHIEALRMIAKHPCFSHESEVRAILRLSSEKIKNYEINYCWARGFAIPYFDLSFPKYAFNMITTLHL